MKQSSLPFRIFGFQIDVARQIERPEVLFDAVKGMSEYGYNVCQLYLEDAFQYPRHPGIARKNAYSVENMKTLHKICHEQDIELIPVIPALGHCNYIVSKEGYQQYDEGRGTDKLLGTVSPSFPETYQLLQELFEDWCNHIPGAYLHVGLDESPAMGQYFIRQKGAQTFDAINMFANHCNKLNKIVKSLGRKMVMWGDMFYHFPEAMEKVDKDIIIADWYYYSFEKTPRIESFNFKAIDSAGELKKAGFEVWGTPSVWPNFPLSNIKDRYQNLKDWVRYGEQVGIDGIVNTDWENSFGFYANSDLAFRVFGKMLTSNDADDLNKEIAKFLCADKSAYQAMNSAVADMLLLGEYSLAAHTNRKLLTESPLAFITSSEARKKEFKSNADNASHLFRDKRNLYSYMNFDRDPHISSLVLCHESIHYFWKTAHIANILWETLMDDNAELNTIQLELDDLIHELQKHVDDYEEYWNTVRYPTDQKPWLDWCKRTIAELKSWFAALDKPRTNHPVLKATRLELTLTCKHPALPVLAIKLHWPDGSTQETTKVMIKFDSSYAVPDKTWQQYPVIVCDKSELPSKIEFTNTHYGQTGISDVRVSQNGKTTLYKPADMSGDNIKEQDGILWLGPKTGTPDLPTVRPNTDKASFIKQNKENSK